MKVYSPAQGRQAPTACSPGPSTQCFLPLTTEKLAQRPFSEEQLVPGPGLCPCQAFWAHPRRYPKLCSYWAEFPDSSRSDGVSPTPTLYHDYLATWLPVLSPHQHPVPSACSDDIAVLCSRYSYAPHARSLVLKPVSTCSHNSIELNGVIMPISMKYKHWKTRLREIK